MIPFNRNISALALLSLALATPASAAKLSDLVDKNIELEAAKTAAPAPASAAPIPVPAPVQGSDIGKSLLPAPSPKKPSKFIEDPSEDIEVVGIYGYPGHYKAEIKVRNTQVTITPGKQFSGWQIASIDADSVTVERERKASASPKKGKPAEPLAAYDRRTLYLSASGNSAAGAMSGAITPNASNLNNPNNPGMPSGYPR